MLMALRSYKTPAKAGAVLEYRRLRVRYATDSVAPESVAAPFARHAPQTVDRERELFLLEVLTGRAGGRFGGSNEGSGGLGRGVALSPMRI
jgi:hypothetical protein